MVASAAEHVPVPTGLDVEIERLEVAEGGLVPVPFIEIGDEVGPELARSAGEAAACRGLAGEARVRAGLLVRFLVEVDHLRGAAVLRVGAVVDDGSDGEIHGVASDDVGVPAHWAHAHRVRDFLAAFAAEEMARREALDGANKYNEERKMDFEGTHAELQTI